MLPHERSIWSDMSGTVELPPKEELAAPEGYHWIEDNWRLDQTGPWIDDALGLGEFLVFYIVNVYLLNSLSTL